VGCGLNPQEAVDLPRFCLEDGTSGGSLSVEDGFPEQTVASLRARGHAPLAVRKGHDRSAFGRAQVIQRDPRTGTLWAGSDGRADGCAIGW
jgi:gamma-glutamyltranspeptidase/glutathione hydrolase